jgi:hypothetical protein
LRQIPHYRGKCPEPYTREEVLEEKFTALLNQISFSPEVLNWVEEPLHESHHDERKFHLGDRATPARAPPCAGSINAMYMDKLDGRIDNEFFDRKAGDFRTEQLRIMGDIAAHQNANQTYIGRASAHLHLLTGLPSCSPTSRLLKSGSCSIVWCRAVSGKMES